MPSKKCHKNRNHNGEYGCDNSKVGKCKANPNCLVQKSTEAGNNKQYEQQTKSFGIDGEFTDQFI